jgi:hypothetical protein
MIDKIIAAAVLSLTASAIGKLRKPKQSKVSDAYADEVKRQKGNEKHTAQ